MSDSGGSKGAVAEAGKVVNEAVVKPVLDEVGKAIEEGFQSVTGKTPTPQQTQQRQADDQKKLAEATRKIEWWKQIEVQQAAVRQQKTQEQVQTQQVKTEEQQVKQYKVQEKKQNLEAQEVARTRSEARAGKGVGG